MQPTVAIGVGNETAYHVHLGVLKGIPFFADMLESSGAWKNTSLKIDLPCTGAELGLLLLRKYTGRALGTSGLPVESCSSALRLAAAAALLQIDDELPELP